MHTYTAHERLAREIADFVPPPVLYNGTLYHIAESDIEPRPTRTDAVHILRTARFALEARMSPQLALEGADLPTLHKNVALLFNSIDALKRARPKGPERDALDALHPLDFLSTLSELESARRQVLTEPSPERIEMYAKMFRAAVAAYKASTAKLRAELSRFPDEPHATYAVWGGTISTHAYLEALQRMDEEITLREETFNSRLACYRGESKHCVPLNTTLASLTLAHPPEVLRDTTIPESVREHLTILDRYHRLIPDTVDGAYVSTSTRPIALLGGSSCYPGANPAFYFHWPLQNPQGAPASRIEALNDIYFFTFDDQSEPGTYRRYSYDHGITFNYQAVGNYYLCPESGKTTGRVAALYALYDAIRDAPIFANIDATHPDIAKLKTLEEEIRNAESISEEAVYRYLDLLRGYLTQNGERVAANTLGGDALLQIYHLVALWNQQSVGLAEHIGTIQYFNDELLPILAVQDPGTRYLLMMRSYVSFLLMPFNASFTNGSDITLFAEHATSTAGYREEASHLMTYRTGQFSTLTISELLRTMESVRLRTHEMHEELRREILKRTP